MTNVKAFLFSWLLPVCLLAAGQQGVHTPEPGSPDRRAVMDVMRLDIYPDVAEAHRNSQKVFFNVYFLRVHGDWALAEVHPVDGAGRDVAEPRWRLLRLVSGQ
jgi:hypothetical protein